MQKLCVASVVRALSNSFSASVRVLKDWSTGWKNQHPLPFPQLLSHKRALFIFFSVQASLGNKVWYCWIAKSSANILSHMLSSTAAEHWPIKYHQKTWGYREEPFSLTFPQLRLIMQATFTYTPFKPCASIQKGRKQLHMSRQSCTADKNLELHRSLEAIKLISSRCKNNCFAKFDNLDNLKSLRSTFLNFDTQTLKKQFMKDLLLAGIEDHMDYMDKQFRLGDIPVCYKYVHKLFGLQTLSSPLWKGPLTPGTQQTAQDLLVQVLRFMEWHSTRPWWGAFTLVFQRWSV